MRALQHLVLQLNFSASLWCRWWELPVFYQDTAYEESFLPASGCADSHRPCPEELKSLFIRTWLKLSGEMALEMARGLPLPAVGLWWRVQRDEMCPYWLFNSRCNIETLLPAGTLFHFAKVLRLHCPECELYFDFMPKRNVWRTILGPTGEDEQWTCSLQQCMWPLYPLLSVAPQYSKDRVASCSCSPSQRRWAASPLTEMERSREISPSLLHQKQQLKRTLLTSAGATCWSWLPQSWNPALHSPDVERPAYSISKYTRLFVYFRLS